MAEQTSTKTITRLGVLTVLTYNAIEENRLTGDVRVNAKHAIKDILGGKTHVPARKVQVRSVERCVLGGMYVGYSCPIPGGAEMIVPITGVN